jgi:T5SS/PEP-CTERM-associated repeat protein
MKQLVSLAALLLVSAFAPARAYEAGSDGTVPVEMDAGGTLLDPAQYTIGVVPDYVRNFSGQYAIIGYNTGANSLTIENGGDLIDTGAYVGLNTDFNSVTVAGSGSTWTTSTDLTVGYKGSGNGLTISNGGQVTADTSILGDGDTIILSQGNSNSATVTGSGSTWTMSGGLTVGNFGSGNELTISNGALVTDAGCYIGGGAYPLPAAGNNNKATVTGSGSTWTNSGELVVGGFGTGNELTISNGAHVTAGSGGIGFLGDTVAYANSNRATVTGPDSLWTIGGGLIVGGGYASGNTLTIEDSALVNLTLSSASVVFGLGTTHGTNALRINSGYFAWAGDHTVEIADFLADGRVLHWSGIEWTAAPGGIYTYTYAYYADAAAASAATGGRYNDLAGGYTILTAVPEPREYGIALAALLGGAILLRRRTLSSTVTPQLQP